MFVKEIDAIRLEQGRRYCLPKKERGQFREWILIRVEDRLYFLTEEEWNRVKPVESCIKLHKAVGRRIERDIGIGIISFVKTDSRGRISVPPSMRKVKGAR